MPSRHLTPLPARLYYFCWGAALARLEAQIALPMLARRFPQLALAGEPTLNNSTLLHGIKHLPVNLGPALVVGNH